MRNEAIAMQQVQQAVERKLLAVKPPVDQPMPSVSNLIMIVALIGLVPTIACILIGWIYSSIGWIFASVIIVQSFAFALVVVVLIHLLYTRPRVRRLLDGNYLVHWTFNVDERKAYVQYAIREAKSKIVQWPVAIALFWTVIAVFVFTDWFSLQGLWKLGLSYLACVVGGLALGYFVALVTSWRRKRLEFQMGDAVIGLDWGYWNQFHWAHDSSSKVYKIKIIEAEGFRVLNMVSSQRGKTGKNYHEVKVPIPVDCEQEAKLLVRILNASPEVRSRVRARMEKQVMQSLKPTITD